MLEPKRLCPDTFVLRNVCAHTRLCPYTSVPIHVCAHKRLCPQTFAPIHVCAQTRLCSRTFQPTHVRAHTCLCLYTCLSTNVSGHKYVWAQMCLGTNVCGHKRVWAQTCVVTNVCEHTRVWAQIMCLRQTYPCVRKSCYECSCHEVVCLRIRAKHMNFYVFAVYRNPDADDSQLDCLLTAMSEVQQTDRKSSFVFVGDFNAHHREWHGSVSQTDAHCRALLDFATSSSCQQLVAGPTNSAANPLYLVLTDVPGVVSVVVLPPVGRSDHSSLLLSLNVDQPVMNFTVEKEVYVWYYLGECSSGCWVSVVG